MENFKVYEEISADGKSSVVYASWTHRKIQYFTTGETVMNDRCFYLLAYTIKDGAKVTTKIDSPDIRKIQDRIRGYYGKHYFDNLKAELYKRYKKMKICIISQITAYTFA